MFLERATPQGFTCFTITQQGASNSCEHLIAVFASKKLLYESSLPWKILAATRDSLSKLLNEYSPAF